MRSTAQTRSISRHVDRICQPYCLQSPTPFWSEPRSPPCSIAEETEAELPQ